MENIYKDDIWNVAEKPFSSYSSLESINEITHRIIGVCFDVHNELGRGFSEVVYKDAIEHEFQKRNIVYQREKKFEIKYKDIVLPHYYFADFVVEEDVILEIKAGQGAIESHFKQVINYLAVSNCPVGLVINFGEQSLKFKRVALTK